MSRAKWLEDTLRNAHCRECGNGLDFAIVEGVGVARPPADATHIIGPAVAVRVACARCGRISTVLNEMPLRKDLDEYMHKIIVWAWQEYAFIRKKREIQWKQERPPEREIPEQPGAGNHPEQPRPSICPGTPATPISADEQRRFLSRLHRTSMKRKTKSFQDWLQRMTR